MLSMRVWRKLLNQKGQSIVEIALITPLVLIALMIPIDFALMYHAAQQTQNAVRETARRGAGQSSFDQAILQSDLTNKLSLFSLSGSPSVTLLKTTPAGCTHVVTATATINYPYFFYRMMNWFGANIGTSTPIARTSRMRYEFQPTTNSGAACTA
jgi:Flp pilus assembly protein TadG